MRQIRDTTAHLERPDDFYAALLAAHEGLTKEESDALNARLILVLAGNVSEHKELMRALDMARVKNDL